MEDDTPIKIRLTRNLSSADATTGDRVDFEVLEDIKVKDVIVVPRGGLALVTVTEAQHKRRMARGGNLFAIAGASRMASDGGECAPTCGILPISCVFSRTWFKNTADFV